MFFIKAAKGLAYFGLGVGLLHIGSLIFLGPGVFSRSPGGGLVLNRAMSKAYGEVLTETVFMMGASIALGLLALIAAALVGIAENTDRADEPK